ncbi:hypothetical protein LQR30_22040 [Chromobacterium piscinae]|uniref:hypothetical protein n=1 Tax=Chromobacterium piscinae TaxID=686831 RepID=UPI001E3C7109|nr:hypothetical protein [Chromobacterium piscinae]MCD4506754.1 hypothetical protein [Chromobacterium piscinae]
MPKKFAERCREALLARNYKHYVEAAVSKLESVYARFLESGCADSNFEKQLRSQDRAVFAQRLGEMLLFERLSHAGFQFKSENDGPDFKVEKNGEVAWLELVTPSTGDDSKINELFKSHNPLSPSREASREQRERILLRISAGISAKLCQFEKYREKGQVKPGEACVIVVNDALLCPDTMEYGVSLGADAGIGGASLVEHAVLGISYQYGIEDDTTNQYKLVSTFREEAPNRPEPTKEGNVRSPVPVSLFTRPTSEWPQTLSNRAQVISAVLQVTLREDYGVLMCRRDRVEQQDRIGENLLFPGTLVRNPNATVALPHSIEQDLQRMTNLPPLSTQESLELELRRRAMWLGLAYAPPLSS